MDRKKNRNGSASASLKDLPYEIVSDILSRLCVKSLGRFRCVSKCWCSFVSDRSFVDLHITCSHDRTLMSLPITYTEDNLTVMNFSDPQFSFFTIDHQHETVTPVHFLNNQQRFLGSWVIGSVNGIIFLQQCETIHACNPITRETITLPPSSRNTKRSRVFSFGFDPTTNQYKILKSWVEHPRRGGRVTKHKVLTLGTKSWRQIKCDCPMEIPYLQSVCINGAIHFRNSNGLHGEVVMAFDVGAEKFRTIALPDAASNLGRKSILMKLKDCLALLDHEELDRFGTMKMWILDDYQNQVWREHNVILPFLGVEGGCFLVGRIHTGEIILIPGSFTGEINSMPTYNDMSSLDVFYYDMESDSLREEELPGIPTKVCQALCQVSGLLFLNFAPTDYVETILSPREFCS